MSDPASRARHPADPLLPDNWAELAPLVDAVLDAPLEHRGEVLDRASAGDPERRAQLERLVAECERDVPLLNRPATERFDRLVAPEEIPLPETLGGRYRIDRELGRGGMARVYLAHDVKHSRAVAVKVIRPELAVSLGSERFLREIAIAARLRHPNIVPLYDSGDADGLLYFVMPYEEGPSLRARLSQDTRMSVAESVSTLRDVARALAYAHEQGVVHRDVKPDNVMLSGGAAVVTDFGIAKAVSVAQGDVPLGTLTQSGAGIGTPAYMAPEQAIGDPSTDHRADIYSFGCLAYEVFTGKPPFHGRPTHQIIASHVGTIPNPVSDLRTDVPERISRLIAKCLEKDPVARPQSAQELLIELETASAAPNIGPRRQPLRRPVLAALVALGVAIVVTAGWTMVHGRAPAAPPVRPELSVAVLPLLSVGGDSIQRELADGLSDEIATALFRVPGVRVVSRRGVGNYSGLREVDPAKLGRELGAQFLVMGSLREVGGRLRVLATLIDAADGTMLWSDQYDRAQDDLGAVRDEISRFVGDTLRRRSGVTVNALAGGQKPHRTINPDAYRLYLLAQAALNHRGLSIQTSVDRFRRATELDTLYAEAFSGLSLALALTPYFQPTSSRAVAAEVTSTAERAMRLDPTLAQPHIALGLVAQHDYDWNRAADEFRTALNLNSRDVEARVQYGRHLVFRGRVDEGLKQFVLAQSDEPASALVSSWVSYAYYLQGRVDSALVVSGRAFQSDTMNLTTLTMGALVRLKARDTAGAVNFARRLPRTHMMALYVLGLAGDTATVTARLRAFESARPKPWMAETTRALAMLGSGDTTQALAALERATLANENWSSLEAVRDPLFDPIRASARFQTLLARVKLTGDATANPR